MRSFLEDVVFRIQSLNAQLGDYCLILPSKRAGGFLTNILKNTTAQTSFAPQILSIEEFVEDLSNLNIIDPTELLFKSYEAYLATSAFEQKEDFDTFSTWAITLLNDFNEVDRYLVPQIAFFNYLSSIKKLEQWGISENKTPLIENYIKFWEGLPEFYQNLHEILLDDGLGYQGMAYRRAAMNVDAYINGNKDKKHIFIGFNALNASEQQIIQKLLQIDGNLIFWDIDQVFFEDPLHSASYFIRKYVGEWDFYITNPIHFIGNTFSEPKLIQIVEAQKNIAQAKYIGQLLSNLSPSEINNTAIVLGDENLLLPILYSLPNNIQGINITMGVTIKSFPEVVFFELLFNLHLRRTDTLYYKDILSILNHPLGAILVPEANSISNKLTRENITHLSILNLEEFFDPFESGILPVLFGDWSEDSLTALNNALLILEEIQKRSRSSLVETVVLTQLTCIFNKMLALNEKYTHLKTIKTVLKLFSELTATTNLDFEGDAYSGLQLMGVLETRVLDFDNVIITSVNEGIFPSGKSNASFITFDLKKQFQLPTFSEKDSIYTYHFYRLLQRAKNITLLYNNHTDGLNSGEKSRFIRQIEIEKKPEHTIKKVVLTPAINIKPKAPKQIVKTEAVMARLREIGQNGFSPSALTNYIRNPIDFYFQKILKLNEFEEVEETVAANTLGTIVHDTLEVFYRPFVNRELTQPALTAMKKLIHVEITAQFKKSFKAGNFSKGKNLIIFEVAKRYISNFLDREIAEISSGNSIKILYIERDLSMEIPIPELEFPIKIHGKVDRVDLYNGQFRIIDFKTGSVSQSDVEIVDWETLNQEYKFSKAFQILTYSLMMKNELPMENAEAGIISFKNLGAGVLKFGVKEKLGSRNKSQTITDEILDTFTVELKKLIMEICDPNIPFTEKEID